MRLAAPLLFVSALPCGAETLSMPAAALSHLPPGGFALPVDCDLTAECYIQNHVDHDPGPGVSDVACGTLSYDGHTGTDFALPTRADLHAPPAVLAAADGTVRATRDGEPDSAFADGTSVSGVECGNGVLIDHADGWQTQYCHMKSGSIAVTPGTKVAQGTALGQIGQSGLAEFPHLHFELRHDGRSVDPFDLVPDESCGQDLQSAWADPPDYDPGRILAAGLTDTIPDFDAIKRGQMPPDPEGLSDKLVLWVYGFGLREGDGFDITLTMPGAEDLQTHVTADASKVLYLRYSGRKIAPPRDLGDAVSGEVTLTRDGKALQTLAVTP